MSLRSFHIFFIVLSASFCLGFAGWTLRAYMLGSPGVLTWGALSLLMGIFLIPYLRWFLKNSRREDLLRRASKYLGCAVCFAGSGADPNTAAMGVAFSWGAVLLLGATMGILGTIVFSVIRIEKERNHPQKRIWYNIDD
ncbi:hypothetical protein IIA15_02370 [candidate division TA06 bacterium]|nr:hypothetical protein [candidate division TA06 bacterium]